MEFIVTAFREGGWAMYIILLGILLSWGVAAVAGVVATISRGALPAMVLGCLTLVGGLGTGIAGLGGYAVGLAKVEEAIPRAAPENRERLRTRGEELVRYPLYFGLFGSSVPLAVGTIVLGVGMVRRREGTPSER